MNKNIDLTKLLKDCPSGMELDCTMYENVTFVEVCKDTNTLYPIYCITTDENGNRSGCSFTKNGYASPRNSSKCVIFPKGKTTWEGFQKPFKDGDILYIDCNDDEDTYKQYQYTFILKEISDGKIYCYCYIDEANIHKSFEICLLTDMRYNPRLATKEEKQRLFDAIKENGYKWNADEKKLEKLIEPKFKVGDRIKRIKNGNIYEITKIIPNYYIAKYFGSDIMISFENQDEYELVPTPKFKVGDTIRSKNGLQIYNITNVTSEYYSTKVGERAVVGILPVKDQDDWILIQNRLITEYKIYYTRESTGEDHHLTFSTQEAMEGCLECMRETNKTCTTYLNIVCKKETVETLDL